MQQRSASQEQLNKIFIWVRRTKQSTVGLKAPAKTVIISPPRPFRSAHSRLGSFQPHRSSPDGNNAAVCFSLASDRCCTPITTDTQLSLVALTCLISHTQSEVLCLSCSTHATVSCLKRALLTVEWKELISQCWWQFFVFAKLSMCSVFQPLVPCQRKQLPTHAVRTLTCKSNSALRSCRHA